MLPKHDRHEEVLPCRCPIIDPIPSSHIFSLSLHMHTSRVWTLTCAYDFQCHACSEFVPLLFSQNSVRVQFSCGMWVALSDELRAGIYDMLMNSNPVHPDDSYGYCKPAVMGLALITEPRSCGLHSEGSWRVWSRLNNRALHTHTQALTLRFTPFAGPSGQWFVVPHGPKLILYWVFWVRM